MNTGLRSHSIQYLKQFCPLACCRLPKYTETVTSNSTGCQTAVAVSVTSAETSSPLSDADTTVVCVDKFSVMPAVARNYQGKS